MTGTNDARTWLRANGHSSVADKIDSIMETWRKRGVKTRRNWWDILAGDRAGLPRQAGGFTFPVIDTARSRKGWPSSDDEVSSQDGEGTPSPSSNPARRSRKKSPNTATKVSGTTSGEPRTRARVSASKGAKARIGDALPALRVEKFAHLENIVVPLADLVVLVGPQATGKSLVLQLLKLAVDRNRVVHSLRQHGFTWTTPEEFTALYFGGGFEKSWGNSTKVGYANQDVTLKDVAFARARKGEDAVFYIPAHRTLAIAEGWPRSFVQYVVETPFVVRRFSEQLLTSLNQGLVGKGKIFPHDRRLKDAFRRLIDKAVFHGATLKLDTIGMRKQFVLEYENEARLPFMTWTAGQREFTPLLLGLYHLLPAGGGPKKKEVQWAIIEEPEMGLHPRAIVAVMAVVLDLMARGYKVALSTHSPAVLEVIWGMSRLKGLSDGPARLCEMMGLPSKERSVLGTAEAALNRTYAVVHVQHNDDGRVVSKDISHLDPGADDPREWGWGGLTGFSAIVANVVASARSVR